MTKMHLRYFVLLFLISIGSAYAAESTYKQTVDGVAIYIGIVPAELVRGHPPEHPEGAMHGGPRFNESHLTVALFDAKSGKRIGNAVITARVSDSRGVNAQRKLESMLIADSLTYGNYFPMTDAGPFRIELEIIVPGMKKPIRALFTWARS